MADKYGWNKMQARSQFKGNTSKVKKYCFYRETINEDIKMWIEPAKETEGYLVIKTTRDNNKPFNERFTRKFIAQFNTAIEAKEWTNKEYAHMFE
jgi:hypothetical protein